MSPTRTAAAARALAHPQEGEMCLEHNVDKGTFWTYGHCGQMDIVEMLRGHYSSRFDNEKFLDPSFQLNFPCVTQTKRLGP